MHEVSIDVPQQMAVALDM